MTPTDARLLAAIQASPVALRAMNAAAACFDAGWDDAAVDVLREAAEVVCEDSPDLEPGPLQLVLGHLVAEMRRAARSDDDARRHVN